jgi:diguanylate cyclase (GGDEF)-like protein/PAS domain S-box-containing protein
MLAGAPSLSSELLRQTFEAAASASLRREKSQFLAAIDLAPVLIWISGPDHRREYFNRRWLNFRGRTLAQEADSGWRDGLRPNDRETTEVQLERAHETREPFEVEYQLRRHDGRYRWMLDVAAARFSNDGEFLGYVGGCIDITDRKEAQLKLEAQLATSEEAHARLAAQSQLAESDPLTGMLNRRSFRDQFKREWDRAARYQRALSCIMLDIDFFKKINDAYGHATGDAVLQRVADLLAGQCRPSDRICRYGGEEFCIVAPETNECGAATLAERLRATLAASPLEIDGHTIRIAGSFGVAERTTAVSNMDGLIERADQALRVAKHSGRNLVIQFGIHDGAIGQPSRPSDPAAVLAQVTARELAVPTPAINSDETIQFAVDFLLRQSLTSLPVVDANGKLVGSISERDLLMGDLTTEHWSLRVRDVMKTNVVAYDTHTPGDEIFQFLCRVSIQQVVIIDNGRPQGIVNLGAVLNFLQRHVAGEAASDPSA